MKQAWGGGSVAGCSLVTWPLFPGHGDRWTCGWAWRLLPEASRGAVLALSSSSETPAPLWGDPWHCVLLACGC